MTTNLFVCDRVENMTIENAHTFNCSKCNALIGMTKEGYARHLKIKNIKAICHECFWKYKGKVKIKPLNKKQMEELKRYIPDLTEEKMRETLLNIEEIKNDTIIPT